MVAGTLIASTHPNASNIKMTAHSADPSANLTMACSPSFSGALAIFALALAIDVNI